MSPSSRKAPKVAIDFFEESNAGTRALPRSLAPKAGGFVFVSGQLARDENGDVIAGGIETHTRQTMKISLTQNWPAAQSRIW
jgi:enamine deaminase RidA (YjgF/YER057c/UK114 family)